eukprot:scaffold568_cov160-Amphora_coffeaeformis.AAC.12
MEEVAQALDNAKWKEIVSVQAHQHQTVNLIASLDTENGGLQWNQIPDEQVVSRHLDAKQWIIPMLNDERRNQLYYEAIQAALAKLQPDNPDDEETIHVFDLGCGTGLLGMMAAKICPAVRVTSVDMSMVCVQVATQIVTDNQLTDRITLQEGHSTQMLPLQANLCVSELLEDGLLGEGWLPAIRDAWKRHLNLKASKPPIVIPSGATVYAQLIQGEWLRDYVGPKPYKTQNGSFIHFHPPNEPSLVPTAVIPMHVGHLMEKGMLTALSDPVELFNFDVSQADRVPGPEGRQVLRTVESSKEGTVHAILVCWNLELFPGIVYSLYDPDDATVRQDHWHTCMHVLETSFDATPNQTWTIQARHDDYSIQVSLLPADPVPAVKRERNETAPVSTYLSPSRVCQMNQCTRRRALEQGVKDELERDKSPTAVLDLSDFCLAALVAAREGVPNVLSLERIEARAAVRAIQANDLQKHIQVLQGHFEQISVENLPQDDGSERKALLVVAEPSYTQLHYWPHLEALQLYYIIRGLSRRLGTTWSIRATPERARIMAAAIQAPELTKAYGPCHSLNEKYKLDHAHVNEQYYAGFSDREISLSIWQYEFDMLTDPFEVFTLPYSGTSVDVSVSESTNHPFVKAGICHGAVVWVVYEFSDGSTIHSNCPSTLGTRQAVYLWEEGVQVDQSDARGFESVWDTRTEAFSWRIVSP